MDINKKVENRSPLEKAYFVAAVDEDLIAKGKPTVQEMVAKAREGWTKLDLDLDDKLIRAKMKLGVWGNEGRLPQDEQRDLVALGSFIHNLITGEPYGSFEPETDLGRKYMFEVLGSKGEPLSVEGFAEETEDFFSNNLTDELQTMYASKKSGGDLYVVCFGNRFASMEPF